MTSFKAVELIFERSLNISGKPSNPWLGYGYGEGWTNPTRTRTPGQPAALTRGFLKPVTIPSWKQWAQARNGGLKLETVGLLGNGGLTLEMAGSCWKRWARIENGSLVLKTAGLR